MSVSFKGVSYGLLICGCPHSHYCRNSMNLMRCVIISQKESKLEGCGKVWGRSGKSKLDQNTFREILNFY